MSSSAWLGLLASLTCWRYSGPARLPVRGITAKQPERLGLSLTPVRILGTCHAGLKQFALDER